MGINIFILAFILSMIFILILRRIFLFSPVKNTRFVLEKDNRKIVKLGGLTLFLALSLTGLSGLAKPLFSNSLALTIYLSASLVLILGILDDFLELKVWQKFLGELVIALLFISISGMTTEIVFLPKSINFVLTLIWILGITNAFNLLDIQDGLAMGVSFLISLAFLYLAYIGGNFLVGIFAIILAGSLLAVLVFNFPPAKIYLGDSGSLFLGFIFSILAISISYAKSAHEAALLSPIFILGFPIYDTVFVSLMRLSQDKPVFIKTDDHFILRLIAVGKKKTPALFTCYLMTVVFISLGILFTKLSNTSSVILVVVSLAVLIRVYFRIKIFKA